MASSCYYCKNTCFAMNVTKLLFLLMLLYGTDSVFSFEYQVGGGKGWVVPPSNDTRIYNDWASENRFIIGDTVRFRYKKDSVMEVSEEEYKKCNPTHPKYFSNNGNTVYELDHAGSYYFISGVAGHCGKGQKMIIKVLTTSDDDANNGNGSSNIPPSHGGEDHHNGKTSSAAAVLGGFHSSAAVVLIMTTIVASIF